MLRRRDGSRVRLCLYVHLAGAFLAAFFVVPRAWATNYVISTANTTDNTTDDRRCSLREAITASNTMQAVHPHTTGGPDCAAGTGTDVIQLGNAEYILNHPVNVNRSLQIVGTDVDATTITANLGGGSCGDPTVDCPDGYAIQVTGANANLTLQKAALRGGSTILFAHGILLDGTVGSPVLNVVDARISDFTASGIWAQGGTTNVQYSVIRDNTGGLEGGGGIHIGSLILPVGHISGVLHMVGSSLVNNSAEGNGGGLFVFGGGNNTSIDACTFSNNFSLGIGGGMYSDSPETPEYVFLTHSTFTLNQARVSGGGISTGQMQNIRSAANIITNNSAPIAPDLQGLWFSGYSVIGTTDGYGGPQIAPNSVGDPPSSVLGDLIPSGGAHKTLVHPLVLGSPAIDFDRGDNIGLGTEAPGVDQRGLPRPQDGGSGRGAFWDAGAFEVQPNELLFGFDALGLWTSTAPLSLNNTKKTQGLFGLNVGGSGYRVLNSVPFKTPLSPLTSNVRVDLFIPPNQPNSQWLGAVQMYATCPSANLYNVYFGQVDLTGKPVNAFSTLAFTLPASIRTAFGQQRSDCFLSIAVNMNATPVAPVIDNLQLVP